MKAITLTQPWATLVISGAKTIETRSWKTPFRGRLAIHAAKGMPPDAMQICREEPFKSVLAALPRWDIGDLPRGMVLGTVELLDCLPIMTWTVSRLEHGHVQDSIGYVPPKIGSNEYAFGGWGPGRFAWVLGNVQRFEHPILAIGKLSLWEWPGP